MLEILYKPNKSYPLGHLQTYDIQVAVEDNHTDNVIKEDIAFIEITPGVYSLDYKLNGNTLEKLKDILVAPANHLNDYVNYLYENVAYVKLNGAELFNANDLEQAGGDEDATTSNE